jgi:hypothetical protein
MSGSVGGDPIARLEQAAGRETRRLATKGQVDRVERRSSRRGQIVTALSLLIAILSVSWSGWNSLQISRNEARDAAEDVITTEGLESLRAANEKLVEQGLPEIPLPREGDRVDADAVAAAAAALMYDRIRNDPAFQGPQGPVGPTGAAGTPGSPCLPSEPACVGPGGPEGPSGAEGAAGADGDKGDRGDPGLPCLPENPACVGPMGPPGPLCPSGYTPEPRPMLTETWWVCVSEQE